MYSGHNSHENSQSAVLFLRITITKNVLKKRKRQKNSYISYERPTVNFKIDELTHQDLGQMQMYVTIGILMCKEADKELVELTLPENSNIYAREYKLYLPDKELLRQKLHEWIEEEINEYTE